MTGRRPRRQLPSVPSEIGTPAPCLMKGDATTMKELVALHEQAEHIETLAKSAKAILRERLPDYARLHYAAAEKAAERGDDRPAAWALSNIRIGHESPAPVVEPPAKNATGGSGVKILINLPIGGLPPGIGQPRTIDVATEPDDTSEEN